MPIEIPKDKWPGKIKTITIGATIEEGGTRSKSITIGGQTTLPYLHFEAPMPNKPVIAIEIKSRKSDDWSPLLVEAWGDAMEEPAEWAKKAEEAGADLLVLALTLADSPEDAVKAVKSVLGASGLPLIVWGPGQAEKDNELLVLVAEATKGDALQGDAMTQLPMIVTPGFEAWKAKESKVGEGVPESWGDWKARAINWETLTATALVESGGDIVVLRHPESVKRVQGVIDELFAVPA